MIVVPIQFVIALILGGVGLVLLIITHITSRMRKIIIKRRKKNERERKNN